jgi:hypothetical protein
VSEGKVINKLFEGLAVLIRFQTVMTIENYKNGKLEEVCFD